MDWLQHALTPVQAATLGLTLVGLLLTWYIALRNGVFGRPRIVLRVGHLRQVNSKKAAFRSMRSQPRIAVIVLPDMEHHDVILDLPLYIWNQSKTNTEDLVITLMYSEDFSVAKVTRDKEMLAHLKHFEQHRFVREASQNPMGETHVTMRMKDLHPTESWATIERLYIDTMPLKKKGKAPSSDYVMARISYRLSAKKRRAVWGILNLVICVGNSLEEGVEKIDSLMHRPGSVFQSEPRRPVLMWRKAAIGDKVAVAIPVIRMKRNVQASHYTHFSIPEKGQPLIMYTMETPCKQGFVLY